MERLCADERRNKLLHDDDARRFIFFSGKFSSVFLAVQSFGRIEIFPADLHFPGKKIRIKEKENSCFFFLERMGEENSIAMGKPYHLKALLRREIRPASFSIPNQAWIHRSRVILHPGESPADSSSAGIFQKISGIPWKNSKRFHIPPVPRPP